MINENGLLNIFPTAEASGSIVSFENGADGIPMESLSVAIEPTQDLHGYSHPWPAGGGVNLLPADYTESITVSKVFLFDTPLPAGQYTLSFISADTSSQVDSYQLGRYRDETGNYVYTAVNPTKGFATFTNREPCSKIVLFSNKAYNESAGFTTVFTGLMLKAGGTGTYSPYSNICPISGRTGLSVYVSPTQDQQDATTYAVDWSTQAGTVYGGTLDVVTGVLTVDRASISSYAGETLPGAWISDRDVYAPGTSPTTGAQVVYELATPSTYQLTPQEVATLLGANRVWSNAGDISLVYHAQVDATPSSIDGLFINGEGLQADGWFLKWRKLAAPKPKTDYVSVWGRDGDIDLTESETDGQVFYENRELTMDMVYIGEDWTDAYSELLDMLHGKECAVQFSNDPYWYWAGRIIASLYEHKPHSLTMSGIMFPYKLSVAKVTRSATVSGAIESNGVDVVLPCSRMRVSPKVTVVAGTGESVTLKWGTKTQTLSAGTYYVRGLKVGSDDVTIKVWGTGTVTFEYRKGML